MRIVAFTDSRYLRIAENWLRALDRLSLLSRVTVVALDAQIRDTMSHRGVRCRFDPAPSTEFSVLWLHRTMILQAMMDESDEPIVHSDVDAVWMRDPDELLNNETADVIFSQGTVWPEESFIKRRFVLCCGLFFVRPNTRTKKLFRDLTALTAELADDQWALNRLVDQYQLSWTVKEPYLVSCLEREFLASREAIRGTSSMLSVSVLPHHKVPRLMWGSLSDDVVIGHPLSGKTQQEAEATLREHGLWLDVDGGDLT